MSNSPDEHDDDRIDCPFCGKLHFPGSGTASATNWSWDDDARCPHLFFLAVDSSGYSGFEFRSKRFNRHFNLPDTRDDEIEIPSEEDPEETLSVEEIIEHLEKEIKGLELRSYTDEGGIACGPVGGGTVTFGFIPTDANQ